MTIKKPSLVKGGHLWLTDRFHYKGQILVKVCIGQVNSLEDALLTVQNYKNLKNWAS